MTLLVPVRPAYALPGGCVTRVVVPTRTITERPCEIVSDHQFPDDEHMSKRERQKARRAQKQETQAKERAAAQRRRTGVIGVVVVVVLALAGFGGWQWYSGVQERGAAVAEAEERFDDFGCDPIETVQNYGAAHFSTDEEIASNPPDVVYPDRPATSGTHFPFWSITGVFDKAIDERVIVHNLEHGYTVFWYDADAPEDEVDELKEWAADRIDGSFPKVVVAEYPDPLPQGNFASVGWDVRQECESFDPTIALAFLDQHNGLESGAPEMSLQPHITDGADPDDVEGDMLYPPLDESAVPDETMDEGDLDDVDDETDDGEDADPDTEGDDAEDDA